MIYLLFNPYSNNNQGEQTKEKIKKELVEIDTKYSSLEEVNIASKDFDKECFLTKLTAEDELILLGGDGTLNKFANNIYNRELKCKMFIFRAGTGNDFITDVAGENEKLVELNKYLKKLPKVTVNRTTVRFINNVGFGLDGQICEVADEMKEKGKKKINYTSIAIKLLLFKYHAPDAIVKVDDKELTFKKVWIASAMNGRYYGGGMKMAPEQDRLSNEISFVMVHGGNRLSTLILFPKIFSGAHVSHKKRVTIIKGKRIEVKFSSPKAIQIDGEVIKNVTSYVAEID